VAPRGRVVASGLVLVSSDCGIIINFRHLSRIVVIMFIGPLMIHLLRLLVLVTSPLFSLAQVCRQRIGIRLTLVGDRSASLQHEPQKRAEIADEVRLIEVTE
jgi:hypothetical protein